MKKIFYCIILFLICQVTHAQKKKIQIKYTKNNDKSVSFYFNKNVPGSYFLKVEFSELNNCNSGKVFKQVIKHSTGRLFTLEPYNKNKGISFSYNYNYIIGNPRVKIKKDIHYTLPFKTGKSIKIYEASNVSEKYFGSDKPENWKSFIYRSKNADTIHSMRKGIVVKITDKYDSDTHNC